MSFRAIKKIPQTGMPKSQCVPKFLCKHDYSLMGYLRRQKSCSDGDVCKGGMAQGVISVGVNFGI